MKDEIEKRLSEFFLIQKKTDRVQLPSFEQVVEKASIRLIPWNLKLLLKVAAILVVVVIPIYYMNHKTKKRETNKIAKGDQVLWTAKMQTDYFLVSATYLWNWNAPTDALLQDKNSLDEIMINDKGDK